MTSYEDSVWCCLWSSYCTPPQPAASQYLKCSMVVSLLALALVLVRIRKRGKTNSPKNANAEDDNVVAAGDAALKTDSFSKMKTFLKKVVSQTNRCMEHGERSGKSIDSLKDVRRLADELMRKADRQHKMLQRGEANAVAGSPKSSPRIPPPPPPKSSPRIPPPPPPPPTLSDIINAKKKLHSA